VALLLALILGVAGTSAEDGARHSDGHGSVVNGFRDGGSAGPFESLSRSAAGSGHAGVAHPGSAGGLEPEPSSELELDDDPSSDATLPRVDSAGSRSSRLVWSREDSRAHPIHPGANRSRAPPHA